MMLSLSVWGRGFTGKWNKETVQGAGDVLYLDSGLGYTDLCNY